MRYCARVHARLAKLTPLRCHIVVADEYQAALGAAECVQRDHPVPEAEVVPELLLAELRPIE
eukprot:2344677-Ditylum_brightwellii.AAC.1